MKQTVIHALRTVAQGIFSHKWLSFGIPLAALASFLILTIGSAIIIGSYNKYVLADVASQHSHVGLVLGAGVAKDGKPFKELQARLDVAAAALQRGQVDTLLLSGDNRFKDYDEPTAMRNYLVNVKHVDAAKLQPDYAGRSTYESCERAAKVFKLKQTIIFSAQSHLPRAIYLCRHFGIESYGVASHLEANNAWRRELLARVKAVYNAKVHGDPTILGAPIPLDK